MNGRDVIITGIPRSGTTLVCALLNELPNTVALIEPMPVQRFAGMGGPREWRAAIKAFFTEQRDSLFQRGTAITRTAADGLDDNTFSAEKGNNGGRISRIQIKKIKVEKQINEDFLLAIKHPNAFTAILEHLVEHFCCFAVIRNPVAVLASWNTVNIPLRDGHAPAAEALEPALAKELAALKDARARQIRLLSWYYERYRRLLPPERIFRYEEIIASAGRVLNAVTPEAKRLQEPLENRDRNPLYDRALMGELANRLRASAGAFWDYYATDDLEV